MGKSTTFNLLTKLTIAAENFPFCTIEPNKARPCPRPCAEPIRPGVSQPYGTTLHAGAQARVNVPDHRFLWLVDLYKPKSQVSAFLDVVDIAGLVKCACPAARGVHGCLGCNVSQAMAAAQCSGHDIF